MGRFDKKVVLVTGASRGIGLAIAERFAGEGARVVMWSNVAGELEQAAAGLQEAGGSVVWRTVDVADPEAVEDGIRRTAESEKRIDILANNAGIAWEESFTEIKDANWRKIIDVNLNGMFYVAQRTSRHMVAQGGGGVIINMASTNGLAGEAKYAHYNASKGGVVLLTKTMALELGAYGIRVNAVCPGYIQTPLSQSIDSEEMVRRYIDEKIPLGRVGRAEDVAGVFAFLASPDAAFITGESIVVDGGQLAF